MQTINLLQDIGLIGNNNIVESIIQKHNDIHNCIDNSANCETSHIDHNNESIDSNTGYQNETSDVEHNNEPVDVNTEYQNETATIPDELKPQPQCEYVESDEISINYSELIDSTQLKDILINYCVNNHDKCKSKKMIINSDVDQNDENADQFIITMKAFGIEVNIMTDGSIIETEDIQVELDDIKTDEPIIETNDIDDEPITVSEDLKNNEVKNPIIETEDIQVEPIDLKDKAIENSTKTYGKKYFVDYLHNNKGLSETKSHIAIKRIFDIILDLLIGKKGKLIVNDYTFYTMKPKGKRKHHAFCDIIADINVSNDSNTTEQLIDINKHTESTVFIYHPDNTIYSVIDNILKVNGIKADVTTLEIDLPFLKSNKNNVDISDINDIQIMPKELFTYKGSDNRNMVGLRFISTIGTKLIDRLQMEGISKITDIDIMVTVGKAFDFGIKDRFVQPRRVALQHQKAIQITKITKQEI